MRPPPPRSTLFPYTTLFRSGMAHRIRAWSRGRSCRYQQTPEPYHFESDFHYAESGDRSLAWTSGLRRPDRSEEHTSELQSHVNLVCRLLLEKKKNPSLELTI